MAYVLFCYLRIFVNLTYDPANVSMTSLFRKSEILILQERRALLMLLDAFFFLLNL